MDIFLRVIMKTEATMMNMTLAEISRKVPSAPVSGRTVPVLLTISLVMVPVGTSPVPIRPPSRFSSLGSAEFSSWAAVMENSTSASAL